MILQSGARTLRRVARKAPSNPCFNCTRSKYRAHNTWSATEKMSGSELPDYSQWTNEALINRVTALEKELRVQNDAHSSRCLKMAVWPAAEEPKKPKMKRDFVPSKYATRYIALKVAYLGQNYNGFEHHQGNKTPLPTIEEELWKALTKTRLIFPTNGMEGEVNWEGCEYSKCGRTDKGVSAFGQVIGLNVRTNKPLDESEADSSVSDDPSSVKSRRISFDPVADEIDYPRVLNRVLPDDIRVLAWCPSPPSEFSARFSCRERRYKYFFTQPAFLSRPGARGVDQNESYDGWLDIPAMREAAKYFEGLHDFRNFCKIDASKQITNFERRIFRADIEEVHSCQGLPNSVNLPAISPSGLQEAGEAKIFSITVHGTAFLWHQIRHMAAVLFLIGQGFEQPSLVPQLLDVANIPGKPHYEMAHDAPLVLWDCVFPDETGDSHQDSLKWIYAAGQAGSLLSPALSDGCYGPGGIIDVLWSGWRRKKIDELLAGSLLDAVMGQQLRLNATPAATTNGGMDNRDPLTVRPSRKVFDGGNLPRLKGKYVPLLDRKRMETVEVQNQHFAARKGRNASTAVAGQSISDTADERTAP